MHTMMHLINFGINVQPDPLKFVQLNRHYPSFEMLLQEGGYHPPKGCEITNDTSQCPDMEMAMAEDPATNFTLCQGPFTYDVRKSPCPRLHLGFIYRDALGWSVSLPV